MLGFSNWYHGWSSAKKSWCCVWTLASLQLYGGP